MAGIAASASKLSGDVRMLQAFGEIEEPFESEQIGSSAMAYKRNPMRSERIAALARFVQTLEPNANLTHGVQYFERTLDDSANRRLVLPQAFLAVDAVLPPGPNNAVGVVWMQLSKPHYGIHGTSAPETIGYATSNGCVRLTNWDAARLAQMVKPGTEVVFEA